MFLVDTSVWIATFRRDSPLALEGVVAMDDIVTCLPVVQEVLQGFRDERAYRLAREAMLALPRVESPMGEGVYLEAASLFRVARSRGYTIRSGTDCLIAACALRNGLTILHKDRDFSLLAQVSGLQERSL